MGVSAVPGPSAELGQGSKEHSNLRTTVTFQLSGQAQDVPEMELELELPLIVEVPFSFLEVSQKCEGLSSTYRGKTPLSQKIPTSFLGWRDMCPSCHMYPGFGIPC